MRYSTPTQNESEQRNALSDKIHSIEFPSLLTCLLLSSSTTIIKKDQKLRKNNGVNNTRKKKNLTFLTVLGLSKKKTRKRKKEIKEEKPKRYIIPPEYYPCTTPLWTCMFLIVLVSILFGELNSVEIEFSHWTPILNFIMVWIRTRNKCAVFICQPKIRARIPSNRVLDFFWWLGGLYEVGCESW